LGANSRPGQDEVMTTTLLESTGAPSADRILQGVIGILEQVFPGRVRGYFVRGSYASDTSTEGSDLDMFVVFKDAFVEPAEAGKARSICRHCALLSPHSLGDPGGERATAAPRGQPCDRASAQAR
jgi:hypothetical protein